LSILPFDNILDEVKKHYVAFTLILFTIFILRLPSLFEPFWYGDEGIFAAVARNLNLGGTLYQTAWDNKPPMIYLTYAGIFGAFGVSMFALRLVTLIVVLATATTIYEIGFETIGRRRALVATAIFGILSSIRLVEGNLALTEIFMILPITLAFFISIKRKFDYWALFLAGGLFAIASLYKQVGAFEAGALGLFLFLYVNNFWEFIKKGLVLALGFAIPYVVTLAYFFSKHLVGDFIFAAYTYYRIYLAESPKHAILVTGAKFLPILAAFSWGFWKKRRGEVNYISLFILWGAFSFLGSFFSGRTYGHYLIQVTPPLALLLASLGSFRKMRIPTVVFILAFILPIIFLTKTLFVGVTSRNLSEQFAYEKNFIDLARGAKSTEAYNNYFDRNVNLLMAARDFLNLKGANGKSVYIWGDWSWLYAASDLRDPSRYVTSFHVFGVPGGKEEVIASLSKSKPVYIIKTPNAIGHFDQLEKIILADYKVVIEFNNVQIFERR